MSSSSVIPSSPSPGNVARETSGREADSVGSVTDSRATEASQEGKTNATGNVKKRSRNREGTKQTYETCREKFSQQRLSGTTIIFTAKWAMAVFIAFFAIFLALGVMLYEAASEIVTYDIQYGAPYTGNSPNKGWHGRAPWLGQKSIVHFTIEEDMHGPIIVHFGLRNFYQNHRRYAKSRSWAQLNGEDPWDHYGCAPWSFDSNNPKNVNYPCGLIARSTPTDYYYALKKGPGETSYSQLIIDRELEDIIDPRLNVLDSFKNILPNDPIVKKGQDPEAIAKEEQERNAADPDNEEVSDAPKSGLLNFWLLKQYPPQTCQPVIGDPEKVTTDGFKPLYVAYSSKDKRTPMCDWTTMACLYSTDRDKVYKKDETLAENPQAAVSCEDHIKHYEETKGTTGGYAHSYEIKNHKHFGIQDPTFIGWMQVAGYSSFTKTWGKIRAATGGGPTLAKGTSITLYIEDNFQVYSFGGEKYFSITTQNWLGTSSTGLAITYMITAIVCLLSAIYLMFLWLKRRKEYASIPLDFVRPVEDVDAS